MSKASDLVRRIDEAPIDTRASAAIEAGIPSNEPLFPELNMRFLMMMVPAVYQHDTPADFTPPADAVEQMTKYNQELQKAGVMLTAEGLYPPITGARVRFGGGKPKVTDGPFAESKELIGGYWIISVKSREEAIEWASRCPAAPGDMIDLRQIYEMEDYPADVREAAGY